MRACNDVRAWQALRACADRRTAQQARQGCRAKAAAFAWRRRAAVAPAEGLRATEALYAEADRSADASPAAHSPADRTVREKMMMRGMPTVAALAIAACIGAPNPADAALTPAPDAIAVPPVAQQSVQLAQAATTATTTTKRTKRLK